MTSTSLPAPDTDALQRRVDDMPPAARRLDWDEDGTPLPASSVVYLFRSRDRDFPLWDMIKTQERLQIVREAPEQFELLTLFTVPVDDLARTSLAKILEARLHLDRIKAATEKAISGMREVARETAARP
ncbi:hypothetical protein [Massilia sp. HP4]|uniref:hypothetical protein n=1 Tax=Massilia sp. HP4 TaxID=2562316 RepID=UPI0010C0E717|nr:hypothetical protein [Massilia sp. HP4]